MQNKLAFNPEVFHQFGYNLRLMINCDDHRWLWAQILPTYR